MRISTVRAITAGLGFAALSLQTFECSAQIGITLATDRRKYMRYEPIRARILLRNYSANTLVFSGEAANKGYLLFDIETADQMGTRATDPAVNPVADLILGAGETRQLVLVLNNLYNLQKEGVYRITAQIGHPRLPNDYKSKTVTVEVRDGAAVWSRTVGLPAVGVAAPIKSREVSLLAFHEDPGDLYCLRVEDDEMVYGVVRLGARLGGAEPDCDMDAVSNVHTLLQVRPRLYAYRVYDYNVKLKQEKYFIPEGESLPRLARDPDIGRIMVTGGRVAVEGVDYEVLGARRQKGSEPTFEPPPPAGAD